MSIIKLLVFLLGSAGLVYISRGSLRSLFQNGAFVHGVNRLIAWEIILAVILLNLNAWFADPLSWNQILSWLLLAVSIFLVLHGLWLLGKLGGKDPQRVDPALLGLEKTSRIVQRGAYRFIRHPLYSSLLFLGWGAFFKLPSWAGLDLALAMSAFLYLTARSEEHENLAYFGTEYAAYMQRTKMFVPFVF